MNLQEKTQGYRCTLCGKEFAYTGSDRLTCPDCGEKGILDIIFNYEAIRKSLNIESLARNHNYSMWRYHELMPLAGEDFRNCLRVGWTPLYPSLHFGPRYGLAKLYIKDDGVNPSASLKDRASGVAVMRAKELGYETIACASTGNAASSMACNAARLGLKAVIFVPERAPLGKLSQMLCFGAKVVSVAGNYRETFELSKAAIERYGWYNRNAGINPVMLEGKKTVSLEIAEQLEFNVPDWVICSVGDGCTIGGVYQGFYDLCQLGLITHMPKIMGVQSSNCCPCVTAFEKGTELEAAAENTIADSISVGVPRNPTKAMRAVSLSGGTWLAVSDEEILATIKELASSEGVFSEPAAAAAAAAVPKALEQGILKSSDTVVVISSGSGLKDTKNALAAGGEPLRSAANLENLDKLF